MGDSDSDSENEIRYGTPLEPYEEDEVPSKRKYQQQPDQYAVDAHGRRRFHGAFTGGFSAGFGNSVGTPEGWTPTTFKSSRSEKAAFASQRAEDYMDDEDRGEFGIAPRHMQTHNEFSGQKRQRQQQFHDGPIPGEAVLSQLLRPVHETAAVRMLRAMGWRQGQGAGERLSSEARRKARDQHKVYGCSMPPEMRQTQEDAEDSSDSEFEYETLFAPDDYEPYILNRKCDRFGLGYSGLSRHSVLGNLVGEYGSGAGSSKSHLVMKDKGRKVSIRGQAFGVGAFEADDEDIYATEDMTHYDFALGGAVDDSQKKKPVKKSGQVIEGFVKSSQPLPAVASYPAPALPRDYVPAPAGVRRSRFEPITQPQRDQGLGRHELSAEARGILLGETPVPKVQDLPKPVETVKAQEPVQLAERTINFASTEQREMDYIPIHDSGKELTKVFKPFVTNPQKQARYEQYLQDKDSLIMETRETDRLSEWERSREMAEFEQAAKLYKPLTGVMGDRFTHAAEPDDGALNPLCAVSKSSVNYGLASAEQIEAATRGLYGMMTRREVQWRPEALVSKRFNVPEVGGVRPPESAADKPKVSYSIFSYLESSVHDKESFTKEQTKFSGSKSLNRDTVENPNGSKQKQAENKCIVDQKQEFNPVPTGFNKRLTVAELFLKESEKDLSTKEVEVTDTINKFDKMDLYKAIFQSDSEDEVVESGRNEKSDFLDRPKNTERNMSPPRGIFANIDFDELNSWRRKDREEKPKPAEPKPLDDPTDNKPEDVYGPKLPDNLQSRLQSDKVIDVNSSSSEDSWVDAREIKSKKQKKKKSKKSKSKHKKSKHKKKDR